VTSIKPLAWVIIIGDGMHNLTDGLAVGVAISQSLGLGLSTAMAILFHEIPHELSDYAILLHTGMSWYKALFLNFASALTSLLGFFVGVAIGTDSEESEEWLLAVIAGQFLYIALVDLLPELLHSKEEGLQKVLQVIMSVIGLAVGFSVLLVIALFEDAINVSVN
jgi:zinc transporter ZupT